MMYDEQGRQVRIAGTNDGSDDKYNYQVDRNLDPHNVVMLLRSYNKLALLKRIRRLKKSGWQLEHYHGELGAVLIR